MLFSLFSLHANTNKIYNTNEENKVYIWWKRKEKKKKVRRRWIIFHLMIVDNWRKGGLGHE